MNHIPEKMGRRGKMTMKRAGHTGHVAARSRRSSPYHVIMSDTCFILDYSVWRNVFFYFSFLFII